MGSSIEELEKLLKEALYETYLLHGELGDEGHEEIGKNEFGETVLRFDAEAGEKILDKLRVYNLHIIVHSEEHGVVEIGDYPLYLGVLDGLDGSKAYKECSGRYATMFAIFSGTNPTYDDYLVSGVMEHSTGRLFYAVKGRGTYIIEDKKVSRIHCSNCYELNEDTRICADREFDESRGTNIIRDAFLTKLKEYDIDGQISSAVHYADLVSGQVDLVLECTRKHNLEIAVAYGLVREAGGAMVTPDLNSLGCRRYLEFGQDEYIPIISGSTEKLVQDVHEELVTVRF